MDREVLQYSARGVELLRAGKYEEALVVLAQALDRDPSNVPVLTNIGWAKHCLGRFHEAITYHQRALELVPHDAITLDNYCASLSAIGLTLDAVSLMTKYIDAFGGTAKILASRGGLYQRLKQWRAAQEDLELALRMDAHCIAAHLNYANLLANLRQMDGALVHADYAAAHGEPRAAVLAKRIRADLASRR